MSYEKLFITYAVSLHFTQEVNEIIFNTMASIADLIGNDFMIKNKVPPHITIGAFHGTKETEEKLIRIVEEFSNTLATRLNQSQFEKAAEIARKITLPLESKISNIGFYQCSPFLELNRFPLA